MHVLDRKDDVSRDPVGDICTMFSMGIEEGTEALTEFIAMSGSSGYHGLPREFVTATAEALLTSDWSPVGRAFVNREFVGEDGRFLLIGPYTLFRAGVSSTVLTGVYGQVPPGVPALEFTVPLKELFGQTADVAEVIPFRCLSSFGHAAEIQGEAFLVPDAWEFPGCGAGPALNNMTAQQRRFDSFSQSCLLRIFAPSSAELLMTALSEPSSAALVRHREFQFHEAGHASGLDLRRKLDADVLPTPWYRGVEEWRADGVEFELLTRMAGVEVAGQTIGANYCLRFGVDAHRQGGVERDTDVISTLLTLNSLLRGRALYIDRDRKLRLQDESFAGLVEASRMHRDQALQLTRDEMKLSVEQGLWMLYGSILVDPATHVVFDGLVREPCRNVPGAQLK